MKFDAVRFRGWSAPSLAAFVFFLVRIWVKFTGSIRLGDGAALFLSRRGWCCARIAASRR
jgi:hypothetical protein